MASRSLLSGLRSLGAVAVGELRLSIDGFLDFVIMQEVLIHLDAHRQRSPHDKEAGGQLFAEISREAWHIVRATGPRRTDFRSRFGFRPNRNAEREEIRSLFSEGLHYVGDWHTHPECRPTPSSSDLNSLRDMVANSRHELPGFVMIIVGQDPWPAGLWMSLHTSSGAVLQPTVTHCPSSV